jgi:hypothetical protein
VRLVVFVDAPRIVIIDSPPCVGIPLYRNTVITKKPGGVEKNNKKLAAFKKKCYKTAVFCFGG